ncbi:phenylacetate-CoA oxygenase/reductase subunit PaaK [Mucilaginibacter koreensis]
MANELQLRVERIVWETPDTATFYLKELSGQKVNYLAGQFITLLFQHHQEEIRRSYSLSSSPDEELLAITVKRVENGEISRFLLMHTKVGDVWPAIPPAGKFTVAEPVTAPHLVYFAAGGGIAPVYAHLKYLLSRQGSSRIMLIYSSQQENGIIFKPELDVLAAQHSNRFSIHYFISSQHKRLNNIGVEQLVQQIIPSGQLHDVQFYLCGPFDYMRMVRLTLQFMDVKPNHIHRENFVLETVPVLSAITNFPPHKLRIFFNNEWHDVVAGENQSILQAAWQNNIRLPFSCRSGVCSACAARCTGGKVELMKNEVLTDEDLAQGWILTCTGYALSDDVVIELK